MNRVVPWADTHRLTTVQREVWFEQAVHGDAPVYKIGGYVQIDGPVDAARFEHAANLLVQKHDALRTVLVRDSGEGDGEGDGVPRQAIVPASAIRVPLHDFSWTTDPHTSARAWVERQLAQPFASNGEPLLGIELAKLDDACFWFLLNCHHLIVDGAAIGLLIDSLAKLYSALEAGDAPALAAPSYLEFIEQDRDYLASPHFERQRAYWLAKYRTVPEPLFAPRCRDRFDAAVARGGYHTLALPRALHRRIAALAQAHGATPFHLMLALWYVYFSRTTQHDDFAVGVPVLNRVNARMKETVGMFAGVSAMRLQFDGEQPFDELLRSIGQMLRQDYRHQRFPISELNRALGLRQAQRQQLFDVSVSYEYDDHDVRFGNSPARSHRCSSGYEPLPLALHIRESRFDENVWVHFSYNLAYFEHHEIEAIADRFRHLLNQVLDDAKTPIARLQLPTPFELDQLTQWNATDAACPHDVTLHALFEMRAASTPDAIAVECDAQRVTYGELNARANRIAHWLIAQRVKLEDRVAICAERSVATVAAMLGVLKAGAAYVSLDPTYPQDRLTWMLRDSAPAALLVRRAGDVSHGLRVPVLDLDAGCGDQPASDPQIDGLTARHLAYVIYTSGSTGQPKGVMVEHRQIVNHMSWMQAAFALAAGDAVVQRTPFSFDASVWEFYAPLLAGGRLVLAGSDGHRNIESLVALLRARSIHTLQLVPTLLAALLATGGLAGCNALRRVFCGGEALPRNLVDAFHAQLPEVELVNLYGPTEATIDATSHVYACGTPTAGSIIGSPIANTRVYVLDAQGAPAPVGVAGELYIGGAGVARGYLNRAALTAARFVADPFSSEPNARMYRTGDLARRLPDGNLEYLGRNDEQIKIRGVRIEPGEIEARLRQHEAVRDAVVGVRETDSGDVRLVAWYTRAAAEAAEPAAEAEALRAHLRARLPETMVPVRCVRVNAWPLLPNGKLDRRALPDPLSDGGARSEYAGPQGDIEQAVADVWSRLLGVTRVGRHDSFFELGGHSLLALKAVSRLRQRLSCGVPLELLFQQPTLSEFAAALERRSADAVEAGHEPELLPRGLRDAPLSLPQERLWVLWRLDPDSCAYNMSGALELRGEFDAHAARRAIDALVERHAMLRTRFREVDDVPRQSILAAEQSADAWRWEAIDVGQMDRASACEQVDTPLDAQPNSRPHAQSPAPLTAQPQSPLRAQLTARAREPFDLERGPLLRATLFKLAPQRHLLHFVIHHIVCDGWSIDVLLREFAALYRAARCGDEAVRTALPALPLQYADYASWQRERFDGAGGVALDAQLAYWRERLTGLRTTIDLPTAHDRSRPYAPRSARIALRVAPPLVAGIATLARDQDTTLFVVLLAALDVLLYRYSGSTDVSVAVPVAGRDRLETEGLIGFFVNTLVMRAQLSAAQPFAALLRQLRADSIAAHANSDVPFDRVVAELQPQRRATGNPLAQVKLMLHDGIDAALDLDGVQCRLVEVDESDARFDLALDVARGPRGLDCTFVYAAELYDETFVAQFAQHYAQVLAQAVHTPQRALGDFVLREMADGERAGDGDSSGARLLPAASVDLS